MGNHRIRYTGHSGLPVPRRSCGCDVMPWEHCLHSYGDAQEAAPDHLATPVPSEAPTPALRVAMAFHEAYERLAPLNGYETRKETRNFDPTTANGRTMLAVCAELLRTDVIRARQE